MLQTTVAVEEVLKGPSVGSTVDVLTDEVVFQASGYQDWRDPGYRVLLFLTPSRETSEAYVLSNLAYSQAAYFAEGQEIDITVGGDATGLSERIAAMSIQEVRAKVEAAEA